jgi:hypothetical protein
MHKDSNLTKVMTAGYYYFNSQLLLNSVLNLNLMPLSKRDLVFPGITCIINFAVENA